MGRKNKERRAVEERRHFDWTEKYEMLLKSGGKCAHCGKVISEGNVTVEHIIPLSKGGTNDMDNLVALCHDCNEDKGDFIYEPKAYYRFLNKDELKRIQDAYEQYLTKVNWLSLTNMYPNDHFETSYYMIMKDRKGNPKPVKAKINVHKASRLPYRQDREKLYEFIDKYNKVHSVECTGTELEESLGSYLDKGCIYYVGDITDLKIVIPVRIENRYYEVLDKCHYDLVFGNPIYFNDTATYADLAAGIVHKISGEIMHLAKRCGVKVMPVCVEMIATNTWYQATVALMTNEMKPSGYGVFDDHKVVKSLTEEKHGGIIPKNLFYGKYYLRDTANENFEYLDGIDGDAAFAIDNENLTRWDRFIQKFCGTEHIMDFSENKDQPLDEFLDGGNLTEGLNT